MPNPLMVFLDPASIPGGALVLPLALTLDGKEKLQGATNIKSKELAVVFLDDRSSEVQQLEHSNMHSTEPLLVIPHASSRLYSPEGIRANPVILGWGEPVVLNGFSHIPGDSTFQRIKALLEGNLTLADFTSAYQNQATFRELDIMAQVLHLEILSGPESITVDIAEQFSGAIRRLSDDDRKAITGRELPRDQLQVVKDIASRLVG